MQHFRTHLESFDTRTRFREIGNGHPSKSYINRPSPRKSYLDRSYIDRSYTNTKGLNDSGGKSWWSSWGSSTTTLDCKKETVVKPPPLVDPSPPPPAPPPAPPDWSKMTGLELPKPDYKIDTSHQPSYIDSMLSFINGFSQLPATLGCKTETVEKTVSEFATLGCKTETVEKTVSELHIITGNKTGNTTTTKTTKQRDCPNKDKKTAETKTTTKVEHTSIRKDGKNTKTETKTTTTETKHLVKPKEGSSKYVGD